ncbi:MAG: D-alanyl-D-alanine carboxypeptidase/D-alanyl-D-alanine-endopeptidase [Myxococcales bacterium]|nr:D-alanyl-D-alanine carboxypeptidase/D-alanyl-D-alanine-endopeptidase [Myxococcales bacterium]
MSYRLLHTLLALSLLVAMPYAVQAARPSPKRLAKILRSAPGRPPAFAKVIDLKTSKVIFELNASKKLTPASVSKMFTTAAAALRIPMKRRLYTDVLIAGKKAKAVKELVIRGGGDMSLSHQQLRGLANKVVKSGIRRIGTLWIDSTLFDRKLPRGFNEKRTDSSYRAPVDALNVDKGTIGIAVRPAGKLGRLALVTINPPSDAIVIDNTAKTVKGKRSALVVRTKAAAKGKTTVIVRGKIGIKRRRPAAVRKRVESAALHAGHAFKKMLQGNKIRIKKVRWRAPKGGYKRFKRLARHTSPSVRELMTFCNQFSHNGYAESFFKLVGAEVKGAPGSCKKAEAAIHIAFKGSKIDWKKVRLGNGSGLYHANDVTADAVVKLLAFMHNKGPIGQAWRRTLAIGGVKGTLRRRLRASVVGAKVYGKTGTLNDVTALAGYAIGKRQKYAFALFFNGLKRPAYLYRRVHDRFLQALMSPGSIKVKAKTRKQKKAKTKTRLRKTHRAKRKAKLRKKRRPPPKSRKKRPKKVHSKAS